jgi:hypothetical protein
MISNKSIGPSNFFVTRYGLETNGWALSIGVVLFDGLTMDIHELDKVQ